MANYTDIPTGEEQGLVSDTIKSFSGKKDTNFYLKLACVGLLCVVAFMSGNVHSRNTVTSMVNTRWGNCQAVSTIVGGECIHNGAGAFSCLDPSKADGYLSFLNGLHLAAFPNAWEKKSCQERGYRNWDRGEDFGPRIPWPERSQLMMESGIDMFCSVLKR